MVKARGQPLAALGDHRGRQPDGRRHRSSHLQRLHEVLHLPEAGSGQHPAGRDAHAEGRARAALGLRDLLAAHALEPVRPAPSLPQGRVRQAGARGRARPGRLHRRAPPDERRPHRGRHRRPEDRAARGAHLRRRSARAIALPFKPIERHRRSCAKPLEPRVMAGFGGVAEYGITVRWDKNFLKIIRLLLERRRQFAMFGGVRFGGTLTIDEAFAAGFDHIALCAGAGRPTVLDDPERLRARRARGLGLPDGAAAHRRRQARVDRQPADPPADRGHRRRPDRDRHRHRVARLLRGAGGEVPRALRGARAEARLERRGARDRGGVHRACTRAAGALRRRRNCPC